MNIAELQNLNLDFNNIGSWPLPIRVAAIAGICVVVLIAGYIIDIKPQQEALAQVEKKEETLKRDFENKQRKSANLELYRQQMADMEKSFGTLLRQLPGKTEVADLLSEVSVAGVAHGLQFDLFQPQQEMPREFYAELPIKLQVAGKYHSFGQFVGDLAVMPRIVTLHNFTILYDEKSSELTMEAEAKTYRYLDDEEIAENEKKAKAKGKPAGRRK